MSLYHDIVEIYPELTANDFNFNQKVLLKDDGDGIEYIAEWNYSKPIPKGMQLGKPQA